MKQKSLKIAMLMGLLFMVTSWASAQDFVYQPINTSFGGSYLNYSSMLNAANAQNTYKDPKEDAINKLIESEDPNQKWNDLQTGLENRLVDAITEKILKEYLGEDGTLKTGSFSLGNFDVDIEESLGGFNINIEDVRSGGSTQIDVPFF
ncbi:MULTISPECIES: curli assembly protein CsgF [Persicobacter]|uniref:Curli production assembly/transport component CsgF n=1 Tax=Persicobacter diffluens TaxID=981 RepID=A0AAN4VU30_9BACT|nr:curli assembly protein CsgF [Persicobacter sp. CCB-QB2]GJM60104.1 hypothetical protein PEDI_06560 [Persicobacter diffluens]